VKSTNGVQRQLRWLLLVLVFISAVNAFVFWNTLHNLIESYRAAARGEKIVSLAGDLERSFFEENKLRGVEGSDDSLGDLRKQIRSLFKDIRENFTEKESISQIKKIESQWRGAHDEAGTRGLLRATKNLVATQEKILGPLQNSADAATSALVSFLALYLVIFLVTVIILGQFMRRRVFYPLARLSEKMKNFQAGHFQLPPQTQNNDEISDLEAQFYDMAGRVGDTVSDLKEIDKAKTDFISIASHELRTPMTAVKGSLSLILSGDLYKIDPDIKEILGIAEKETDRLIRLINDILDLTKMETKQLPLDKKPNDLGSVVKEAVDGVNGLLEVTKVSAKIIDPGYGVKVLIDRDRIQQVITNLLSNAIKFSPAKATVVVSYEAYPNKLGKGAIVRIKDSGNGIKPEDHAHMFEKFRSTDSGRSKVIKGTGLGLPICKALIEQHGGQIGVQSVIGEGSTFYFIIPDPNTVTKAKTPPVAAEEAA
jgi:signal transduction histidine kinase